MDIILLRERFFLVFCVTSSNSGVGVYTVGGIRLSGHNAAAKHEMSNNN